MKKTMLAAVALTLTLAAMGQEKPEQKSPKTKLEAFDARAGVVIIKGLEEVGSIIGTGDVTISCREFVDASSGRKEYGITIQVKESTRLERTSTTLIDYDEIDSLLKGIDYIAKVDKTSTALAGFEAIYKTKGDLRIVSFSTRDGSIETAIQSGTIGTVTAYLTKGQLNHIRGYIEKAKARLDEIKAAQPKEAK